MSELHALGEVGDAGALACMGPSDRQHELMVLRLDASLARCLLAEMEEAPDLVAKVGQGRVIGRFLRSWLDISS